MHELALLEPSKKNAAQNASRLIPEGLTEEPGCSGTRTTHSEVVRFSGAADGATPRLHRAGSRRSGTEAPPPPDASDTPSCVRTATSIPHPVPVNFSRKHAPVASQHL